MSTPPVRDGGTHTVRRVLVADERPAGLDLGLKDSVPQLLSLDGLAAATLALVLVVQLLELVAPDLVQARRLVRVEQCPSAVRLDTLHATQAISGRTVG
jgi:hypothetical protein